MGDPAFDERKFAVGVPVCRTRVLSDQSGATASGLDIMRLPDGRLVQCMPAEYVLLTFEHAKISGCKLFIILSHADQVSFESPPQSSSGDNEILYLVLRLNLEWYSIIVLMFSIASF